MKKIHTSLIFVILILCTSTLVAQKTDFYDEVVGSLDYISVSKESTQLYFFPSMLIYDINKLPVHKKKFKSMIDILNTYIQTDIAAKEKMKIEEKQKRKGMIYYMYYANASSVDGADYLKALGVHHIHLQDIIDFFTTGANLRRVYKKFALTDVMVSRKETYDYLHYTNSKIVEPYFFSYLMYKINITKSNDPILNLFFTDNILQILSKEDFSKDIIDYQASRLIKKNATEYFTVKLNYQAEDDYIDDNLTVEMLSNLNTGSVIGPIYNTNKIFFFKIIEKKSSVNESDIDIRVKHFIVKKHLKNGLITAMLNRQAKIYIDNIKEGKINNFFEILFSKNNCNIEYINKNKTDSIIYNATKDLNKNDFTEIIETDDAFHIFKVLNQEYVVGSNAYDIVYSNIVTRKNNLAKKKYGKIEYEKLYKNIMQ